MWQVAQRVAALDVDERVRAGLAASVEQVSTERERADHAQDAAEAAIAQVSRLQAHLLAAQASAAGLQAQLRAEAEHHAATTLDLAAAKERIRSVELSSAELVTTLQSSLTHANARADGADKRVAHQLERERSNAKKADAAAEAARASADVATLKLQDALERHNEALSNIRAREADLTAKLTSAQETLASAQYRIAECERTAVLANERADAQILHADELRHALSQITQLLVDQQQRHSTTRRRQPPGTTS